jgi:hypothetical protein
MTARQAVLTVLEYALNGEQGESSVAKAAALFADDSTAWLEGTPLMRKLRAKLQQRG